ncbi:MAG: KamA family radical SAM protein [Spirochaetaceae bacterium]|nr:KamA family radical SAM protein [Spirochaetaceae bacterium]
MNIIRRVEDLPEPLRAGVLPEEAAYLRRLGEEPALRGIPLFGVTPHFASLAGSDAADPLRRQFFPSPAEAAPDPFALADPLGEEAHRKAPRLIRQYEDRALLLASGECAGYCRYCFRRIWARKDTGFIDDTRLAPVLAYLARHREIREALISGGDPLTAPDGALDRLLGSLRSVRPDLRLRLCTRVPITFPQRFDRGLLDLLKSYRPLRMAVHINHHRELSPPAREVLGACADAGIPVLTQTVLLRGVNDDAETLARLFAACVDAGLSLYYLFQLDTAQGTAHFRVDLADGLALYANLASRGAALPVYALDLPGGGGKIRLHEGVIAGKREGAYLLRSPSGILYPYPAASGCFKQLPAKRL